MAFTIMILGKAYDGKFCFGRYGNKRLAVQIVGHDESEEMLARVSCNVPDAPVLCNEFVAKTYSENEGLVEQLVEKGLIEHTGKKVVVGYAGEQPIMRMTEKALNRRFVKGDWPPLNFDTAQDIEDFCHENGLRHVRVEWRDGILGMPGKFWVSLNDIYAIINSDGTAADENKDDNEKTTPAERKTKLHKIFAHSNVSVDHR